MDAVSIYFRNSSASQVEEEAAKYGVGATPSVFLRAYEEWEREISEDEKRLLHEALGGNPKSAFLIESRHGENARIALELAAHLMCKLSPAVMDDDLDGLWSVDEVCGYVAASKENTLFSLRGSRG
jgi:hypothetical protein